MSAPPPHRREPLNEPVAAEPPQLTKEFQDYEQHEDDLECEEPELQKGGAEVERVRSQRQKMACLLYTSPSPRDGLLSRMPSSA